MWYPLSTHQFLIVHDLYSMLPSWWESFWSTFFVSNLPSKMLITLITVPSNCSNRRFLFLNLDLSIFSQKFLGIKVTSRLHVDLHAKKYAILLDFLPLVLVDKFIAYILAFSLGLSVPFTIPILLFVLAHNLKVIFLFTVWTYFSQSWAFILISFMFVATIFVFDHELVSL